MRVVFPIVALIRSVLEPVSCTPWLEVGLLPPPQPTMNVPANSTNIPRYFMARLLGPRANGRSRRPRVPPDKSDNSRGRANIVGALPAEALLVELDPIVNDVETFPLAARVADGGLKLHVIPTGNPEHAKVTAPDMPYRDCTCSVTADDCPEYETDSVLADNCTVISEGCA